MRSFSTAVGEAISQDRLYDAMQEITARMDFRHFALVHHIDVRGPGNEAIRLIDYPSDWVAIFEERRLYATDPIHRASQRTSLGFQWSDVGKLITMTERDRAVLAAARAIGIGNGFTIPAHIPGELNGSCSFAAVTGREIDADQLPLAQWIGTFAFEAARRINRPPGASPAPHLTDRQVECVALVARGKTDWEIARILGVGAETVTQHLKDARERYGVTKRTMLAVRALFDGAISFTDILRL